MSNWATSYFGDSLLTKDGVKPTADVLNGKSRVGIYFSAHWCPPCRGFTPVLAEFYDQLKEEDESKLEIIFVSSDRDEDSFKHYYDTMPWTSLLFNDRALKQKLCEKFNVSGIPAFFVLDAADGSIKDADGRSTVGSAMGNTAKALARWA